jgi:hypothetical protein
MPFMLYRSEATNNGPRFDWVRDLQIAGNTGPICKLARERVALDDAQRGWHASEAEILAASGASRDGGAIVIDLKPKVKGNVSLFRLRDVWGYSHDDWTPLALRLESIFADHAAEDPALFKRSFVLPAGAPDQIGEFLYVQGGVRTGTWNWGMVGRVNGALMWPEALEYLSTSLLTAIHRQTHT